MKLKELINVGFKVNVMGSIGRKIASIIKGNATFIFVQVYVKVLKDWDFAAPNYLKSSWRRYHKFNNEELSMEVKI